MNSGMLVNRFISSEFEPYPQVHLDHQDSHEIQHRSFQASVYVETVRFNSTCHLLVHDIGIFTQVEYVAVIVFVKEGKAHNKTNRIQS